MWGQYTCKACAGFCTVLSNCFQCSSFLPTFEASRFTVIRIHMDSCWQEPDLILPTKLFLFPHPQALVYQYLPKAPLRLNKNNSLGSNKPLLASSLLDMFVGESGHPCCTNDAEEAYGATSLKYEGCCYSPRGFTVQFSCWMMLPVLGYRDSKHILYLLGNWLAGPSSVDKQLDDWF